MKAVVVVLVLVLMVTVKGQSVGVNYGLRGLGVNGGAAVFNNQDFKLFVTTGVHVWWEGYGHKNLNMPAGMLVLSEVRERYTGFTVGFVGLFDKWSAGIGADVMPEKLYRKSIVGEYYKEDGWRTRMGVYGSVGYEFFEKTKFLIVHSSERKWMMGLELEI